ncbi:Hypothetical predicted protein [Olea europaea subsp. europaea]|uniref:Uncharacterized protein n=1 Tax=Olea europaea subsp. europaea TaxID=158383 RepID=A0A8S0QTP5_OLEEU|nr:Hypothetical predicted protein [Olea europaea subsp. europaea]
MEKNSKKNFEWRQLGQAETEAGMERWPVAVGELSLLCAVLMCFNGGQWESAVSAVCARQRETGVERERYG